MAKDAIALDPSLFDPATISAETRAINDGILEKLTAGPDQWSFPPQVIRDRRRQGLGPFPLAPRLEHAQTIEIDGPGGPLPLRIIAPQTRPSRGVYFHIHGGGWVLGAADDQDPALAHIAEITGLTAVSVEYRLAPEHPYPAAPDDCEAAALWVIEQANPRFGGDILAIGGESAGAHLSAVTLLRLRDRHGLTPFCAANLVAGCFDLRMTPSVRNWGDEKLILNTRDITKFLECFVPDVARREDPDVSPLLGQLHGMPPALFSIGTRDLLIDDSIMMATRWLSAGNATELAVFPGGAHVFQPFGGALAEESLKRMDMFLVKAI